jgi:hypothetical protein
VQYIRGRPIEYIVQQTVDWMVWGQIDGGAANGGFYYTPNPPNSADFADGSTAEWAYSGLYAVQTHMSAHGVYLNELVKNRLASVLRNSQKFVAAPAPSRPYGSSGTAYRMNMTGYAFQLSAGPLIAMSLLGWNNPAWENSNVVAFDGSMTRGQAYTSFRQQFDYIGDDWNGTGGNDLNLWGRGQWGAAGYLLNDNDYNLYSIEWAANGLAAVGAVCAGGTEAQDADGACTDGNDWKHQHTVLLVRRQTVGTTGASWTSTHGTPMNAGYIYPRMVTAMVVLTLAAAQ